ncbi:MAG TPA: PAS domain S-box protein [Terriglobales bacterium]|nr:PAS domain S-box protein [Terriglobales bacterium]
MPLELSLASASEISPLRRWLLPIGLVGTAYLAAAAVVDIARAPLFPFFTVAVLLASYFGDHRSGLLAVGLSAGINALVMTHARGNWTRLDADHAFRLAAFLLVALVGVGVVYRLQILLERERVLNALVDTNPSMTVVTDASGCILAFNHQCERVTGYKATEVIGKTIPEVFLSEDWIPVVAERFRTFDAEALAHPHENPWRTKSGEERLIEWRCTRIQSPRAEKPLVIGIGIDVTDQKRLAAVLAEAENTRRRTEMVNQLAHEIFNPMQAMTNALTLAQLADGEAEKYIRLAEEQLKRMSEVSSALLVATEKPVGPDS